MNISTMLFIFGGNPNIMGLYLYSDSLLDALILSFSVQLSCSNYQIKIKCITICKRKVKRKKIFSIHQGLC